MKPWKWIQNLHKSEKKIVGRPSDGRPTAVGRSDGHRTAVRRPSHRRKNFERPDGNFSAGRTDENFFGRFFGIFSAFFGRSDGAKRRRISWGFILSNNRPNRSYPRFFFVPPWYTIGPKTHAKFSLPWAFESHEQKYKVIKSTASYYDTDIRPGSRVPWYCSTDIRPTWY